MKIIYKWCKNYQIVAVEQSLSYVSVFYFIDKNFATSPTYCKMHLWCRIIIEILKIFRTQYGHDS